MPVMVRCNRGQSAPLSSIGQLQESQSHDCNGRHKCSVCAYLQGIEDALSEKPTGPVQQCPHGTEAPANLGDALHRDQGGIGRHKCIVCAYQRGRDEAEIQAGVLRYGPQLVLVPEEVRSPETYFEGSVTRVVVDRYERDLRARRACIEAHGYRCRVCDLHFVERYGELGNGYVQVHHLRSLSTIGEKHEVDPINDLVPVCANCHAMLHRSTPPLKPDELRALLQE